MPTIPFNRPSFPAAALRYVEETMAAGCTAGGGPFGERAESLLSDLHEGARCVLTTSGTHSLEMSARLLDLGPGDEVIVPDFTFVSTASAFFWNGALPVLADVEADTLNLDPESVARMISPRTRAICAVHYGGIAADLARLKDLADRARVALIEDNAHGLGGSSDEKPLGTTGAMSILSFHETKNVTCGEGGALVLNDPSLVDHAEILREKGTNRRLFMEGRIDKYTWVDVGSSWIQSEILAAILVAQLERLAETQGRRVAIWERYSEELASWAAQQGARLPTVPGGARHPGHLFYILLPDEATRGRFILHMKERGVLAVFHYQSLSESSVRHRFQLRCDDTVNGRRASRTLVRLPLFDSMTDGDCSRVIEAALAFA